MGRASLWTAVAAAGLAGAAAWGAAVPEALQQVRRHMLDANVNALTFHSMDQIFTTRRTDNAGPPWSLPEAPAALNFSYDYQGASHPAADILDRTFTNALLVIKDGRLVSEIYRNQTGPQTHFVSFSMAKSITSMLIGLALEDGSIHSIDDPITRYVPELDHSAYDGVTIRQALMMRSGADYEERYDFDHPTLASAAFEEALVQNRVRFAAFGRLLNRAYPPGEHFNYSTVETAVLGWTVERATHHTISDYMSERLWKRVGMESYGFWMMDGDTQTGREFNGAGFNAVARDYARLGLLMEHGGNAHGLQILPARWVADSTAPRQAEAVEAGAPLGYRYQWWTLVGTDAYMALGLQGQFIYVDPATHTVVVKLSYFPPGDDRALLDECIAFFRAASAWTPAH